MCGNKIAFDMQESLKKLLLLLFILTGTSLAEETPLTFQLTQDHIEKFRKIPVSWNTVETGAPCLDPERNFTEEDLNVLRILLTFGELEPGKYRYTKPEGEFIEYSFFVEKLPEQIDFSFTNEHRILLKSQYIDLEEDWDEDFILSCDPKRPYGMMTYYELDMAQCLDEPTGKNEEGYATITKEQEERLSELHHSTQAAWQVFLENFTLEPGTFKGDENGNWEKVE